MIERPGALFIPRARPLYLDDHSWQVAYVLSIQPLKIQQSLIGDLLSETKGLIDQTGSFRTQAKYHEIVIELEKGLHDSILNLEALTVRDSCQETRRRRGGLVNVAGNVLRLLFGILDWKTVQRVSELDTAVKGAVHDLDQHVSVLKDTHDAVMNQSRLIEQVWEYINQNVSVEISRINQQLDLDKLCNLIQSIIVNVHASIFRLQMRVQNWQSGRLSTSMLGQDFLSTITDEIERISKRDFHFHLLTAKISAIGFCNDKYEIGMILSVPEDLSFTLYEVTQLPLYSNDSGKFLILNLPEYIAISNGRNVELTGQMFNEECFSFHTHYSCPQGVSPVRSNAQSCANSLLLSTNMDKTLELCEYTFNTIAHPTLQLIRGTNAIKYILPRPTNCKLTCMQPGQRIERLSTFSLHGSGIYQIQPNCSLNVDDLETFYSRHILYYNESFVIYNHSNAMSLLNVAKYKSSTETKPYAQSSTTNSVPPSSQGLTMISAIIICIVTSVVTLVVSILALIPLYKKLFCITRIDSALNAVMGL